MAYTDFLALLVQDEVARRTQRKFDMRIRRAGFRNQKTLEDFDFSFNPTINKSQIMDLATCRFLEGKASVLIVGPCAPEKATSPRHSATVQSVRGARCSLPPDKAARAAPYRQSNQRL